MVYEFGAVIRVEAPGDEGELQQHTFQHWR